MDKPQGNGAPEAPQGEASGPNYVTKEEFNELINRAMTARFSAVEKRIAQQMAEALSGLGPKLDELLQAKLPQAPQAPAERHLDESPLVKGLQKQLAELQEQNRKSQAERDAERQRARDVALRQKLTEELAKHGVDARYARQAIGYLVDAEKRVRWTDDESDALIFRDADGSELDLPTGLRTWVKTDEAKIYQPPRGAQGSGDRGGTTAPKPLASKYPTTNQIGRALLADFGVRLPDET